MPLDSRLKTIADLVPLNSRVADVGTDHAYLPIHLIKSGKSSSVIATDINEKPLLTAKRNIEIRSIENIELRLCDGLHKIDGNEVDTVIIAGMGGEVISGILDRCSWVKNKGYTLILQPMSRAEDLRRFLCENCFVIKREVATEHSNRLYTVIVAEFDGVKKEYKNSFFYIGKLAENLGQNERKYLEWRYQIICETVDNISNVPRKHELYQELNTVKQELERILQG